MAAIASPSAAETWQKQWQTPEMARLEDCSAHLS
eukprot:CAMPEP_0204145508 /NCGR_PEP_ID=MMETSP0361-20130328/21628_1 /ASSEMBLY_ACC=CAM_ASM_000343 /TAXON_ID=268821 /ORGANISM="Scrippsiella Hangoei, Strain SHTV-5" /LENGTH=33 /DNA_ID= /DNA_START= /DNA_END= /DNA_ORIENTATION=